MPPQVAQRRAPSTAMTTKTKASPPSNNNNDVQPAAVPSSAAAATAAATAAAAAAAEKLGAHGAKVKHKRRFCRIDGCERIVKSQGLCQRHGAKPRLCKVATCEKQAQGNFDGMCKSHFKEHKRKTTPIPAAGAHPSAPPEPEGASVYDSILPTSVNHCHNQTSTNTQPQSTQGTPTTTPSKMPLVVHLADGFHGGKPPAWHRNEERRARGLLPIQNPATQLEGWERELVWMEILVLTGVPDVSFRHLARAWGRDKGFHMVLAQFICERHGDVQRKKRKRDDDYEDEEAAAVVLASAKRGGTVAARKSPSQPSPIPPARAQEPFSRRFSVSAEEMKELRSAMLSPERKKEIVSLLRRRSSDRSDGSAADQLDSIGADAWDDTCYGDANYNEELAADLFNLTQEESVILMRRLSSAGRAAADDDSSSAHSKSAVSRSAYSGLHLQPQLSSPGLKQRDSGGSEVSTNSGNQIPNTVAVKRTPEEADSLGPAFTNDESQAQHQHQLQQQPFTGQVVANTYEQHPGPSQQQQQPLPPQNQGFLQQGAPMSQQEGQGFQQLDQQFVNIEEQNQFQDSEASLDYRRADGHSQQNPVPNQHGGQQQLEYQAVGQQNLQHQIGSHVQPQLQHHHIQMEQPPPSEHLQQQQYSHQADHSQPQPVIQAREFAHPGQHINQPAHQEGGHLEQPQHQHSQQGHPLLRQPNILPNEQAQQNPYSPQVGHHAQSLHQRNHSIQGFQLHGLPQGHQRAHSFQDFGLHQRQHSQQGLHLHGQPQGQQIQQQLHQSQQPHHAVHPLQQNGQAQGQPHGQTNQQGRSEHPGQLLQGNQGPPRHNPPNQPFQHVHHGQPGSNVAFQSQTAHRRQQVQLSNQPEDPELHDYDHHTEHLQAQDDDHLDPSHEHHDYGEEIEHEDHDHQAQENEQHHGPQSQQVHTQPSEHQQMGVHAIHHEQPKNGTGQPFNNSNQGGAYQGQQQQAHASHSVQLQGGQQSVQQPYNSYDQATASDQFQGQPPAQLGEASYSAQQQQVQPPAPHFEQAASTSHLQGQQQPPQQQQTDQQNYNSYEHEQEALFELPYTTAPAANFQQEQNVSQLQHQDVLQQDAHNHSSEQHYIDPNNANAYEQQQHNLNEPQQNNVYHEQPPQQQQQDYHEQPHHQQQPQHLEQHGYPQAHSQPPQGQQHTGESEFQFAEENNFVVVGQQQPQPNNVSGAEAQYEYTDNNRQDMDGHQQGN